MADLLVGAVTIEPLQCTLDGKYSVNSDLLVKVCNRKLISPNNTQLIFLEMGYLHMVHWRCIALILVEKSKRWRERSFVKILCAMLTGGEERKEK